MSAPRCGSMKGPPLKIPLLLLLLLLSAVTRTVFCQNEEDGAEAEAEAEAGAETEVTEAPWELLEGGDAQISDTVDGEAVTPPVEMNPVYPETSPPPEQPPTDNGLPDENGSGVTTTTTESVDSPSPSEMENPESTTDPGVEEVLNPIIILIPVALVVLIICMIVFGIFLSRRWKQQTRHQELRKEDPYLDSPSEEKVPMPMFEEDVPSVLELEMEELDQWMKKDSENSGDSTQT